MLRRAATQTSTTQEVYIGSSNESLFTRLPVRLVFLILELIPPSEIPFLRGVSKWFKQLIDSNDNLVAGQVFQLFFSKQVDSFCEYGDNDLFLLERSKKNSIISHSTKARQYRWREILKSYEAVRLALFKSIDRVFLHAIVANDSSIDSPNQQLQSESPELNRGFFDHLLENPKDNIEEEDNERARSSSQDSVSKCNQYSTQMGSYQFEAVDSNNKSIKKGMKKGEESNENIMRIEKIEEKAGEGVEVEAAKGSPFKFVFEENQQEIGGFERERRTSAALAAGGAGGTDLSNHADGKGNRPVEQINFFGSINFGTNQCDSSSLSSSSDGMSISSVAVAAAAAAAAVARGTFQNDQASKQQVKSSKLAGAATKVLWNLLRDPPLPVLKLRRENIGNFCNTLFQNKLVEVLWEGATKNQQISSSNEESPIVKLNSIVKSHRQFFVQEVLESCAESEAIKDDLLNIRYYFYNQKKQQKQQLLNSKESFIWINNLRKSVDAWSAAESVNPKKFAFTTPVEDIECEDEEEISCAPVVRPMLLSVMESLSELIQFRCQLCFEFLRAHLSNMSESIGCKKNGFDLLSEYNIAWNSYVAFLNEIEDQTKDLFAAFNECFEKVFPMHPAHPSMTLWRLMAKLWIREVYNKDELKENLFGCFLKILSIRRQDNFLYQMNQIKLDSRIEQQYYMPEPLEHLSLTLLNNLTKTKNFSLLDIGEGYEYFHSFFSKNSYYEDSLLTSFVESVLDLSINEISVHFLGHSQIQTDSPYQGLENQLLDSSCTFYKHQKNMFIANPSHYLLFLQADLKYLSKIFKERSIRALKSQVFTHWTEMFKEIIVTLIPQQLVAFEMKDEKMKNLIHTHTASQVIKYSNAPFEDHFFELLRQIINADPNLSTHPTITSNMSLSNQSDESKLNRNSEMYGCFLLHQLFIISDEKTKQDISNYNDLCSANDSLIQCDQDFEIEETNAGRGLPIQLNEQEQRFFFLNVNLNAKILDETIKMQEEFLRAQNEARIRENQENDESYSSSEDQQEAYLAGGAGSINNGAFTIDSSNTASSLSPSSASQSRRANIQSGSQQQQNQQLRNASQRNRKDFFLPVYNSDDDEDQEEQSSLPGFSRNHSNNNQINFFANQSDNNNNNNNQNNGEGHEQENTMNEGINKNNQVCNFNPNNNNNNLSFDFFGVANNGNRKNSAANSDFSLGLSKEQSRVSNSNNMFANISMNDVLVQSSTQPAPADDFFKFNFPIPAQTDPQQQQQQSNLFQLDESHSYSSQQAGRSASPQLLFQQLEKKDSCGNQLSFTFQLKSNDITPSVSTENYFGTVTRSNQNSTMVSSSNNQTQFNNYNCANDMFATTMFSQPHQTESLQQQTKANSIQFQFANNNNNNIFDINDSLLDDRGSTNNNNNNNTILFDNLGNLDDNSPPKFILNRQQSAKK